MTHHELPTHTEADAPLSPPSPAGASLPYPLTALFGFGILAGLAWLGALTLDLWPPLAGLVPPWLRVGGRAVLVLAVPTLVLLALRSRRLPARRHARTFYTLEALLMVVVAIPALLPYASPAELVSIPLRLPTFSLGVAFAAVDPLVIEWWRENRDRDASTALVASAGFGAVLLATGLILLWVGAHSRPCTTPRPGPGSGFACWGAINIAVTALCGGVPVCVLAALFGGWAGYVLGAGIARSDRWL